MIINVHAGHTKQSGASPGASGYVHESVEDRRIKNEVIKILKKRGNVVYDCTADGHNASDNLAKIVTKCNEHKVDLDVSIHLNCYNGKGHGCEVEIFDGSSKAKEYAVKVCREISKFGFTNRGVKEMSYLYVLRIPSHRQC